MTDAAIASHHFTYSPALSTTSVPALVSSRKSRRPSGPPSAISSSPTSSATNSPSPATFASGRLALLSSGPLGALALEEDVTDLDLGEGILASHNNFSPFGGASGGPSIDMGIADVEDGQFRPNGYFSPTDIALLGGTPGKSPVGTIHRLHQSLSPTESLLAELPSSKRTIRERDLTLTGRRPPSSRGSPTSSPGEEKTEEEASRRSRPPTGKHAGLPALFHQAHPQTTASAPPESTGLAEPPLPPSPAIKATVAGPSLTQTAVRNSRRSISRPAAAARSTQSDPTVLLASAARSARATSEERKPKDPKQRDARASLVAALGAKGSPSSPAAGQRSISDSVTASSKLAAAVGETLEERVKRRASVPLGVAAYDAVSSSGSSGISLRSRNSNGGSAFARLGGWQDKIKGVLGRAHAVANRWADDSDDEMTGVALALERRSVPSRPGLALTWTDSRSPFASDSMASQTSLRFSQPASRPLAQPFERASEPIMSQRRQLAGKGNFRAVSDDQSLSSTLATSSAVTTGALPTPERSLSRGRGRANGPLPLTDFQPVAPADFRGRSRRRGAPTAAVRSRSPTRSRSESQARAPSAGGERRRSSTVDVVIENASAEEDEEAAMEADLEDEEEGGGRRRGRSRGRRSFGRESQSRYGQVVQLTPARPIGLEAFGTGGYGYYT